MTEHKTSEERAREILGYVLDETLAASRRPSSEGDEAAFHRLLAVITAAITAAEREAYERCAQIAENPSRRGRDWVPGSLWDALSRETAARIRALVKEGE